jgi:hypothetical protein
LNKNGLIASNKNGISANGRKHGTKVMSFASNGNSLAPGTAIATFKADGTYDTSETNGQNHVAIFAGWHRTWVFGGIDGFCVWDANFEHSKRVGSHLLLQSGSGVFYANSHYVVQS